MSLRVAASLFVAIILLSLVASAYYTLSSYGSILQKLYSERTDSMTSTLKDQISDKLGLSEYSDIQKIIDKTASARDFVKTVSLSTNGKTITQSSEKDGISKPNPTDYLRVYHSSYDHLKKDRYNLLYEVGYYKGGKKESAKLFVELDKEVIFGDIREKTKEVTLNIMLAQFGVVSILAFLLYVFILRPFRIINKTVEDKSGEKRFFAIKEMSDLQNSLIDNFEELRRQNTTLTALLKTSPELIWFKDINGVYRFCNPGFERFFGAKESEILGKTDYDFVDKELADFFRQKDKEAIQKNGPSVNTEWITYQADGARGLLETIKTPVKNESGKPLGVLGISRDITENWQINEKLKERENIYGSIVNQSLEAIVLIDVLNGTFKEFNDAACHMLGYSRDEFAALTLADIQTDDFDENMMKSKVHEVLSNGGGKFEHKHKTKDGKVLEVVIVNKVLEVDGKLYFAAIWHDVTELKEINNKLQMYAKELEEMVKEETQKSLKRERVLAEQSKFAALGRMLSGIAHNWRQPLNALGLIVQDIPQAYKYGELTDEYVANMSKTAMSTINKMSKTIDNFKELAAQDKEAEELDCNAFVLESVNLVGAQLLDANINWSVSCPNLKVYTYKNSLKQAISSILQNAIDALSGVEGERKLEIGCVADGNGAIDFCFFNNGKKIDDESLEKLFEPYFTTKEQGKGVGLGLYFAKIVVEETLKGSIWAANRDDGVEFFIRIPLKQNV